MTAKHLEAIYALREATLRQMEVQQALQQMTSLKEHACTPSDTTRKLPRRR